ncbi:hypothetical protein POVWA2_094630 [Plasmodium ovale wallikeri]|uniref:PIR Superfamily Protein n=1 Tax=Plasmodium ovale wallikeri TaxID=864142 RepID=A0A1A9AT29_PLAOA|nr:hypothetical protein POVWA2_094630 [Plasmodium ovale wallikeri]
MSPPEESTTNLQEKVLPSNYFIKCLFGDKNFENHVKEIEENKSSNNSEKITSIINSKFEEILQDIRSGFSKDEEVRCCVNINYYFDLLYSIIKSPGQLSNDNTNKLITEILQKWDKIPEVNDKDKCKRETDLDSICKRSILKHLHDLKWDKMFIIAFSEKYKNYLGKKWGKIIAYTSRYYDNLYIKIENDFMGIIEKYSDFLNSPDFI